MGSGLPLDTLGLDIKERVAAGDKATSKGEEHYRAAGLHLIEARDRIHSGAEKMTWPAFMGHCSLKKSRVYELIALAEGRATLIGIRERSRVSMAASRERNKKEPVRNVAEKPEAGRLAAALDAYDALNGDEREQFLRARQLLAAVVLASAA